MKADSSCLVSLWNHRLPILFMFVLTLLCVPREGFGASAADAFPNPEQVARDYTDDAEHYVVLNFLWDVLHEKAPAAVAQRSAYYQAAEQIRTRHMVQSTQDAETFNSKVRQLTADHNFRHSILEKYQLIQVKTDAPTPQQRPSGDVTDSMIKGALLTALPVILITLVAMYFVARSSVRKASVKSYIGGSGVIAPGNLPMLPDTLRTVSLPLLKYSVDYVSAFAFDKETTIRTHAVTTTTQGQVYSIGNQVYSTPGTTSTRYYTTETQLVWVRTAANQETSWTFSSSEFKVRPGQIISAITRHVSENSADFLLAYNHNTGQLAQFSGIGSVHRTHGGGAWFKATALGSIGFGIAFWLILRIDPEYLNRDAVDQLLRPVVYWIMGGFTAGIAALFIYWQVSGALLRERHILFHREYVPAFTKFLAELTPVLEKHFGISKSAPPLPTGAKS